MRCRGALATSVFWLVALITLSGCTTQALVSSWKAPDALPFQLKGEKVAAIVMTTDLPMRRAGEDALARQLALHGVRACRCTRSCLIPIPTKRKRARRPSKRTSSGSWLYDQCASTRNSRRGPRPTRARCTADSGAGTGFWVGLRRRDSHEHDRHGRDARIWVAREQAAMGRAKQDHESSQSGSLDRGYGRASRGRTRAARVDPEELAPLHARDVCRRLLSSSSISL